VLFRSVDKLPYMLVVGEKDMAARVVSPRTREGQQQPAEAIESLCRRLVDEARPPLPGILAAAPGAPSAPSAPPVTSG